MSKKNKNQWQVAYWATLLGLSLVFATKIMEITVHERTIMIIRNPEIAQYSTIANGGVF